VLRGFEAKRHAEKLKDLIVATLEDSKAVDVVTLDLEGKTCIADYMIIASGTSQRHVHSLASHISDKLKEAELYSIPPEGTENCDWVVVDAGDIVVHIFRPEVREMYNLEKMWSVALPVAGLEVVS
ncbi:MAG: ribosome silencing factor, partial [Rickettsiales bacterium]